MKIIIKALFVSLLLGSNAQLLAQTPSSSSDATASLDATVCFHMKFIHLGRLWVKAIDSQSMPLGILDAPTKCSKVSTRLSGRKAKVTHPDNTHFANSPISINIAPGKTTHVDVFEDKIVAKSPE